MRMVFMIALMVSCSFEAFAAEKWECFDFIDALSSEVVVVAEVVDSDTNAGSVTVAGTTQKARYYVAGFQRHWDFGPKLDGLDFLPESDGLYQYAFIINPNGNASYHENGKLDPPLRFKCRQSNSKK